MSNQYTRGSLILINSVLLLILIYSCASIGSPNGGPYDEEPPKYVSSTPAPNQTNFKGKKIEILFDELVQLEKPAENVIITPPQRQMPVIRATGKKVSVELRDTMLDNTTYTLDFTNSIVDNNEKNVLENYSFAFSTGDVIDTLEIAGILLNAENLEPMPGITVGLHSNLEDSAFVKEVFTRTSRTNERGRFTIRNIAPGTYRLYALNDLNRDYKFENNPTEDIAFEEIPITPTFEFAERMDTVWVDSVTVDSINIVPYTRFLPDDVTLFLFKEKFERQYMLRPERAENHLFALKFNAPLDTVPLPVPLNFEPADSSWFVIQTADGNRTANFWITDSTVWPLDTLQMELTYSMSDSLNQLVPKTDTIMATMRRRTTENRRSRRNEEEPEPITFLGLNVSSSSSMNLHDTLFVTFNEPVSEMLPEVFCLDQKVDTLWMPVEFEMKPDTTNSLRYLIERQWNYGEEYRLSVDSALLFSVYDRWNDTYSGTFKFKTREEYGHLYINIHGIDSTAFVELLDKSDQPVRKAKLNNGGVLFMDLVPNTYYARLIVDENDNGLWDTGLYAEKRQPEKVYYCPKAMEIIVNWETEEDWDVLATPIDKQKPLDITKNKPKEKQERQRDYKNEGRNSSSSRGGGLPF
ncbi:Ig-like domain-containing protein [Parabacteroides sp. OttesenSCG-928-O15]|nr:Ig-like domain-containing protein [Parabacteroides sp. OttesenSCG-928-O15]